MMRGRRVTANVWRIDKDCWRMWSRREAATEDQGSHTSHFVPSIADYDLLCPVSGAKLMSKWQGRAEGECLGWEEETLRKEALIHHWPEDLPWRKVWPALSEESAKGCQERMRSLWEDEEVEGQAPRNLSNEAGNFYVWLQCHKSPSRISIILFSAEPFIITLLHKLFW